MLIKRPLLGFHASTAGGLHKALEQAGALKCPTVQLFTKNNRSWQEPLVTPEMQSLFITTKRTHNIEIVVSHASYLINLASARPEVRHTSLQGLKAEMARSSLLGIDYVVLHPGSYTTLTQKEGIEHLTEGCNRVLEEKNSPILLLESMAGQGNSLGRTLEELAQVLEKIEDKDSIGICLDTCHLFAAGYPLVTDSEYEKLIQDFDKICGLKYLKVIHVNDSKKECGSRLDRHEHIGKGCININFFKNLMNDQRLYNISKILETPKDSLEDDRINIQTLIELLEK